VANGDPLIYTSGRHPRIPEKLRRVVMSRSREPTDPVTDVRDSMNVEFQMNFTKLSSAELAKRWSACGEDAGISPGQNIVFTISSPAVAPLSCLY